MILVQKKQEKPRSTKNLVKNSRKIQESCHEIRKNPRISGEKAGGLNIPGYNLAHRQEIRTTEIQKGNLKSVEIRVISIQKSIK